MAEIDPEQLLAAVQEASARVQVANSAIQTAKATEKETAQAVARATLQRAQGLIAEMQLEQAQAAIARARATSANARANWALATAALKSAQSRLDRTTILAPIDGMVLARLVEPGQTVTAGFQTPVLFKLAEDLTKLELHVDVDESDVGRLRAGMSGLFTVDAYPGRDFPTTVLSLRNDSKTSQNVVTYEAVLSVQNRDRALRPGMTATANIVSRTIANALVVPNAALRFVPPKSAPIPPDKSRATQKGKKIYLWTPEGLKPLAIEIGATDDHHSEVISAGLDEGSLVAVDVAR